MPADDECQGVPHLRLPGEFLGGSMCQTVSHQPAIEPINAQLTDHQVSIDDWPYSETIAELHEWVERFTDEFKLDVGTPALRIDGLRGRHGHYGLDRNGFGLRDEIALDTEHIRAGPFWQVVGTVLHELLHAWQEHHGVPPSRRSGNYHNRQFRTKAAALGLLVERNGVTRYAQPPSPFWDLLGEHGIYPNKDDRVDENGVIAPPPIDPGSQREEKLKLYVCPCGVKIRSGRSDLRVQCLECDGQFVRRRKMR